jgi:carbamoyl-phosphate synthase large subunit
MKEPIHILMTGGGAPGGPGILHCLLQEKDFSVTVADADTEATGRFLHTDFVQLPKAGDPDFMEQLYAICAAKKIQVILPLVTKELFVLARYKKELAAEGIKVLVSDEASLEIANNKSRLYQFLEWRGLAVPAFRVVENTAQFEQAAQELGYPAKTICFKPSVSNGSRGFRIIAPMADEADLLFNYKPNAAYMGYADAVRILSTKSFPELLVSEYLPGEEYSVDCLARQGETILALPRVRKKIINGITVQGEFIQNETIIAYCRQIIAELKLHGNIGIQVKQNEGGEFRLLEINPRVQGTIAAALGGGINLPALAVKQEMGIPVDPAALRFKWGTRFSRYWTEVFY